MLNPTELEKLCNLFPELSPAQAESIILMSLGSTPEEIADIRQVSAQSVKRSLYDARIKLRMRSLGSLRPAVLLRVMINIFTNVSAQKGQ